MENLLFIHVCSDPTPVHSNTVQGKMHSPLLSAAVQDRFTAGVCLKSYNCEKLLFIHVCSDPTPVHSNTVQGKMHAPLLSAAVQDRFTAGVCQCSYTYGKMLFTHVCSDPTPVHCNTVQGKMHSPLLSAAVQDRFTTGLCQGSYTYGKIALHTRVQCPNTSAQQHCSGQNAFPTAKCCCARQVHSRRVSVQLHLWKNALHTAVQ